MFGLRPRAFRERPNVRIESRRLVLRHPVMEDWPAWARLRSGSREFLQPWEPAWPRNGLTRPAFARRLSDQERRRKAGVAYSFFLFCREADILLGGLSVSGIRRGAAQAGTLGYWIGRDHARRGYMGEAVEAVIAHCFDDLGLHRLEAACMPANLPSRRLLKGRGFRYEGYAHAYLMIDGAWRARKSVV